ncbi:MAG: hypothetical protein K2G04_02200 [Oscillospiraceae bacterium]|nr:hypothetical protein [Oscillospiraceae bacterium]
MTYIEMLMEYKRSENALRERIAQINSDISKAAESMEIDLLRRRKALLENELYDLLDVISDIRDYAGCGVNEKCRNA